MTPELTRIVQDAMTALAKVPHYSGAVVVLFTDDFRTAGMFQHGVKDELTDAALAGLVQQRAIARTPLVLPADYQNREKRRA